MDDSLRDLKAELERFADAHDAATSDRDRRMLNITRDTGQLLALLVRATVARRVLEIGTSNGYSTLWLAEAVRECGGVVVTVESADRKIKLAAENFSRSGLADVITQIHDDAGSVLKRTGDATYDLVFLDSERSHYTAWWWHLRRVLRPGGLLIVDNATSHPYEIASLVTLVSEDPDFTACLVPVGKGEYLAVKSGSVAAAAAQLMSGNC
jgi:predicted O-methyltransferase YrrM